MSALEPASPARARTASSPAEWHQPGWVERALLALANPLLTGFLSTVRVRWCGTQHMLAARRLSGAVIFSPWHESVLWYTWAFRGRGIVAMVSRHRDGERTSRIMEGFGYQTVRGSSTRAGSQALRKMLKMSREGWDLNIVPDGPKGPPRVPQPGIIHLAARSQRTILPLTLTFERCWRARSWDRFVVPVPFTRGVALLAEPLAVPPTACHRKSVAEEYRRLLEARQQEISVRVEEEFESLYRRGVRQLSTFDPPPRPEAGRRYLISEMEST